MHTAWGHLRLPALAASFLAFLPLPASGQSITTEPVAAVPIAGPWLVALLWLTLLLAGMWLLRQEPRQARALVIAGLMASGLWMMQAARAQVVDLQFTSADGETLAIPANQIVGGGGLEGFQRVDYRNNSAISLRIATIVEPGFDACFPAGLDEPLPAPSASSGTACAVGLTLGPDEACRVDVDAICRTRADAAVADITVAPPTENVTLTAVGAPLISISSPVQQSRVIAVSGGALSLEVTNDAGSAVNATGITVANKAAAPDVLVDDSDCVSVAPGASCTLELTSATPYAPATITISGSNTANSPTTLIVFSYLGGLVFEEAGGSGKIVIDAAQEFTSQWTSAYAYVEFASSLLDGAANTNRIVADASCSGDPANCAAQRCRNISADWYLPAERELRAIKDALCSNHTTCDAGGFSASLYWSSTEASSVNAFSVHVPALFSPLHDKTSARGVRCVRPF